MKKLLYVFALLSITHLTFNISEANAQSWQWAKRGGTNVGSTENEELKGIVIDRNGNSYALATIYTIKVSGTIDIDGNKLGSGNGEEDICLISFDCSGKFRWSKIIGGKSIDNAYAIGSDSTDGIYIAGQVLARNKGDSIFFDKDTSFGTTVAAAKPIYKSLFIAKYDTSGKYKWSRFPEPDTLSTFKNSGSFSICSSPNGDVSMLLYAGSTGAFANGSYNIPSTTAIPSIHLLKYNANGNFIKGFPLSISDGDYSSLSSLRMAWDTKNDVYYILALNQGTGFVAPKFGTTTMTGTNCLAKFSNTGANLWVKQSSSSYYVGLNSVPKVDADGNVYFASSEKVGDNFNGYSVTNLLSGAASLPVILKIKGSDGSVLWGKTVSADYSAGGFSVEPGTNGTVVFSTISLRTISIGSFKSYSAGTSMNIALIGLDMNTGAVKFFDTINATNSCTTPILAKDKNNNFYLGGNFDAGLKVNSVGTLSKYGGRNDFFIAKFGVADCKEPVSINENDLQNSNIKIYPNPAQSVITFEGLENGSEVRLFNIVGQQVHNFAAQNNKEQVSINHLVSGMYLVQIRNVAGEVYTAKIVKE